jgi:DNA helicase-2/ATP-dependent DNA helicase PcrA
MSSHNKNALAANHIFADLDFEDFALRNEALKELADRLEAAPVGVQEPLAAFIPKADEYQQRVVDSLANTIRVVAPAGSGKTQTMLNRVLCKIQQGLNPERLLLLTFDNAAASSLTSKLLEFIQELGVDLGTLQIKTLNAFGFAVLRQYVPTEYKQVIPHYRAIKLTKEVREALKEKSEERHKRLAKNIKAHFYIEFFSLLKNELFDPRAPDAQRLSEFILKSPAAVPFFEPGQPRNAVKSIIEALIWLFMAYEKAMQRESLMDFDDQKLRSFLALASSSELKQTLQSRFMEIIVDEFQDINRLDFSLIQLLAEKSALVVTGDDDQAIYGFRGCSPDYIINLQQATGRKVAPFELSINYRNPANLVEHADRLIRHNTNRITKNPIAARKDKADIKIASTFSAGVEARFIVSFIRKVRCANNNLPFKDIAVLYRTNAQSLPLQIEFILNDIPYYVREQDNILTNEILERLLGFLRLKLRILAGAQPSVKDAMLTLHAYFRFVDGSTHHRVERLFNGDRSFFDVLNSEALQNAAHWIASSNIAQSVREAIEAHSLMDTLGVIAKRFKGVRGMVGNLEDAINDHLPLGEVYELAANFGGNTKEFVTTIERALEHARKSGAGKNKESGLALLTYFKAKGLQWHTVILTTCNEGLIPHRRAPVEDERRLFYVAMTRASSNLLISYVKNACNNAVAPSRFIKEAGLL